MKKLFSIVAFLAFATAGYAQSDDFGIWTSFEAQKKINKKVKNLSEKVKEVQP